MGRAKKKGTQGSGEFSLFDESEATDTDGDEDLPRDEAGRAKIKHQYVDLLGIRVQKLAGRILNRERINKTLEGIYFVCAKCRKVCHNLDEGLVEDEANVANTCTPCSRQSSEPSKPASRKAPAPRPEAAEVEPKAEAKPPARVDSKAAKSEPKVAAKPASKTAPARKS